MRPGWTICIANCDTGPVTPGGVMSVIFVIGIFAAIIVLREYVRRRARQSQQQRATGSGAPSQPASAAAASRVTRPDAGGTPADPRAAAWTSLHDPTTPATRLAEIAAAHPEFAAAIGAHPNAYPALRTWADSTVAASASPPPDRHHRAAPGTNQVPPEHL